MQGRSGPQRELLDVESAAGHLLPQGGVFAFLAAHREEVFPDAMFSDLFPSGRGRPSVPAPVVATVLVLQALHGLSDREAAEAVTFDLRWKAACGLAVSAAAFHPTTLTYWRARLAGSDRPNRVFEAVREVVSATGALRGKTRRALDSTVLDDAVATQDTVTQLVAAVRRVARTLPGGQRLVSGAATRSGHDYQRAGKPEIAWEDSTAREQLIDGLVRDARAVLAAVAAAEDDGGLVCEGAAGEAVGLLALVAGQDVELVGDPEHPGGPGTWRIAPSGWHRTGCSARWTRSRGTRTRPRRGVRTGSRPASWSSPTLGSSPPARSPRPAARVPATRPPGRWHLRCALARCSKLNLAPGMTPSPQDRSPYRRLLGARVQNLRQV